MWGRKPIPAAPEFAIVGQETYPNPVIYGIMLGQDCYPHLFTMGGRACSHCRPGRAMVMMDAELSIGASTP
jgi:hypothetical protein